MNSDDECVIFCGNLSPEVTEELLYELFLQVCTYLTASYIILIENSCFRLYKIYSKYPTFSVYRLGH